MAKFDAVSSEAKFVEECKTRLKEIGSRRTSFYKAKQGTNEIRVLRKGPGTPWYVESWVHFGLGPEGKDRCRCPAKEDGKPCVVCREVASLEKSSRRSDEVRRKDISVRRQNLSYVCDLRDTGAGVLVYPMPETVLQELLELFVDPDYGDFTHPKKGYNIRFKRTGQGITDTKYTSVRPAKEPSPIPISYDSIKEILSADLVDIYLLKTKAEMEVLLNGAEDDYPCFGNEYDPDDNTCEECSKAAGCQKATRAGKKTKEGTKEKTRRRIAEEDEEAPW